MYKVELHVHTRYSKDSALPLWLVYTVCRLKRIDAIAITDHNTIQGAKAFSSYCSRRRGHVSVIIGEEIMTQEGEIIGLYLSKNIPEGLTAENTVDKILEQGGVVYIPHPYDAKRNKTVLKECTLKKMLHKVDCIECHNGRNVSESYTVEQQAIAEKYHLVKVIGSDSHTWFELGRNYLLLEKIDLSNPECFKNALPSAVMHKKQCMQFSHQVTKVVRILKMIREGQYRDAIEKTKSKFKK